MGSSSELLSRDTILQQHQRPTYWAAGLWKAFVSSEPGLRWQKTTIFWGSLGWGQNGSSTRMLLKSSKHLFAPVSYGLSPRASHGIGAHDLPYVRYRAQVLKHINHAYWGGGGRCPWMNQTTVWCTELKEKVTTNSNFKCSILPLNIWNVNALNINIS